MSKRQILILDDDEQILRILTAALEAEDYSVRTATSRSTFEAILNQTDPDVFLLDIRLPDGNGMQIAKDLRARSTAGIILVTGQNDSIDRILGLELGADDYIAKPFNIRELRARVNAVYRRTALSRTQQPPHAQAAPSGADPTPLSTLYGMTLDRSARCLTDQTGVEIPLTTLEFDLLVALYDNTNRVLSRDQIMDHLRGPGWAVYDRTVDGLISRLRKKLFPDGLGAQKIKTVHGVGYMLSLAPCKDVS